MEIAKENTTAELVRRSTAQYPETMYENLHETHTRTSKIYTCIAIRGDVETVVNPCGKVCASCTVTNARARRASAGCIKGVLSSAPQLSTSVVVVVFLVCGK